MSEEKVFNGFGNNSKGGNGYPLGERGVQGVQGRGGSIDGRQGRQGVYGEVSQFQGIQGIQGQTLGSDKGNYGGFYYNADQPLLSTSAEQMIELNNQWEANNISLNSNKIVFAFKGVYQVTLTTQLSSLSSDSEYAKFWLKYNNVNISNTTIESFLPPRKNSTTPSTQQVTLNYTIEIGNDNDYITLFWSGTSTDLSLTHEPSEITPIDIPETPSVKVSVIPSKSAIQGTQGLQGGYTEFPSSSWATYYNTKEINVPSGWDVDFRNFDSLIQTAYVPYNAYTKNSPAQGELSQIYPVNGLSYLSGDSINGIIGTLNVRSKLVASISNTGANNANLRSTNINFSANSNSWSGGVTIKAGETKQVVIEYTFPPYTYSGKLAYWYINTLRTSTSTTFTIRNATLTFERVAGNPLGGLQGILGRQGTNGIAIQGVNNTISLLSVDSYTLPSIEASFVNNLVLSNSISPQFTITSQEGGTNNAFTGLKRGDVYLVKGCVYLKNLGLTDTIANLTLASYSPYWVNFGTNVYTPVNNQMTIPADGNSHILNFQIFFLFEGGSIDYITFKISSTTELLAIDSSNVNVSGFQCSISTILRNSGIQGISNSNQGIQGFQGGAPRGVQGLQGRIGIQGDPSYFRPQGTQGTASSIQGIQGRVGDNQGTQGTQGRQGPIAIQGPQGRQGILGRQGIQGGGSSLQGTQGIQGIVGQLGSQGIQGRQGIGGGQGLQGTIGFRGIQGIQGITASQGTQGTQGASVVRPTITTEPQIGINAYYNTNQSLTANTPNQILFNSVDYTDGSISLSSNAFTITQAGEYNFRTILTFENSNALEATIVAWYGYNSFPYWSQEITLKSGEIGTIILELPAPFLNVSGTILEVYAQPNISGVSSISIPSTSDYPLGGANKFIATLVNLQNIVAPPTYACLNFFSGYFPLPFTYGTDIALFPYTDYGEPNPTGNFGGEGSTYFGYLTSQVRIQIKVSGYYDIMVNFGIYDNYGYNDFIADTFEMILLSSTDGTTYNALYTLGSVDLDVFNENFYTVRTLTNSLRTIFLDSTSNKYLKIGYRLNGDDFNVTEGYELNFTINRIS